MSKRTKNPREIDMNSFEGKTIAKVNTKAVNCVTFTFTDGTQACLEAENAMPSIGLLGVSAYEVDQEG